MIIFFEFGKTGNQLFQYIGLKKYFPNEKLVFFGCKELNNFFNDIDVYFVNKNLSLRWILYSLPKILLFFLADLKILGSIREYDHPFEKFNVIVKRGLFSKIFIARDIYFQHKDDIDHIKNPPYQKNHSYEKASEWLREKDIDVSKNPIVFVHVRRRDYLTWPSKEFPAALDFEWYERAMSLIKKKIDSPIFIIMGDDHDFISYNFKESSSLFFSKNSLDIDLSIMSLCSSGILSASSFSWWGAYFSRCNKNENGLFIGPNFWGGYKMKEWFPPNFKVDWITYIN
jgi:hypothetical protein